MSSLDNSSDLSYQCFRARDHFKNFVCGIGGIIMDRVRSLLNSRRVVRVPEDEGERVLLPPQNSVSVESTAEHLYRPHVGGDDDDQMTMIDGDRDDMTMHTLLSESSTIGDFQRLGFVNRCPNFDNERVVPFVSVLLSRGFYAFASEESYKAYLGNKRKIEKFDVQSELGIPLFHALPSNVVKSMFGSRSTPVMRIFKFIVVRTCDANDNEGSTRADVLDFAPQGSELVSELQGTPYSVYKYQFCTIFKAVDTKTGKVEHKFAFSKLTSDVKDTVITENVNMTNYMQSRNADTNYAGLNLRWYGSTGFASPFGSNNIKLLVLDDSMPSYMTQDTLNDYEQARRGERLRPLGYLPVWARYSDDKVSVIPKKRTLRVATLDIKEQNRELSSDNPNTAFGLPWDTQVLTCMCMLLHEYESRKDKRHNATLRSQLVGPGMLM